MPLRVSKPPAFNLPSLSAAAMDPSSLAALNKLAESPPTHLKRSVNPSAPLVLYVFRVPGRQDFCFSLSKPLEDVITDVDISAALYFARCDHPQTGRYTLLRREPARDQTSEVAMVVDSASHIDVFATKYGYIEETYWRMNGNEVMTAKSNFGCTIWREEQPSITFSFLSPWTGRCAFRSVKAAHALRCIYTFPKFSPDEDTTLSELRFNFSGHRRTVKSHFQPSSEGTNKDSSVEPRRGSFDLDRILQSIGAAESTGSARQSKLYGPRPLQQVESAAGRLRSTSDSNADPQKETTAAHKIPRRPVQSEYGATPLRPVSQVNAVLNQPQKSIIRRKEIGSGDRNSVATFDSLKVLDEHLPSVPNHDSQLAEPQEPTISASPDPLDHLSDDETSPATPPALPRRPVATQANGSHETDQPPSPTPTADISPILPPRGLVAESTDTGRPTQRFPVQTPDAPPALPRRPVAKSADSQLPENPAHPQSTVLPPTLPSRPNQEPNIPNSSEPHSAATNTTTQTSDGQTEQPSVVPEDPNDLSLGREKLGGGSDGEQAKLGKMVIYQEGQQMLDMIIAANFLMFYKAYKAAASAQPGEGEARRRSMSLLDLEGHWPHRRGGWN